MTTTLQTMWPAAIAAKYNLCIVPLLFRAQLANLMLEKPHPKKYFIQTSPMPKLVVSNNTDNYVRAWSLSEISKRRQYTIQTRTE
jgi:hypothetical protein